MTPAGLPHSDIRGSQDACSSPRLIAACHVLLRLSAPRHPPCALTALDQFRPVTRPPQLNAREPDHTPEPATPRSIYPRCLLPLHPNCQKAGPKSVQYTNLGIGRRGRAISENRSARREPTGCHQKGGDPAPGYPTATLLRLRSCHRSFLRPLT